MLQVNDKFGQGILWKFLTGKYYQPRNEERIFMFLDLKSSTMLAEKLGHTRFFELLKELYQDITEPILRSIGEIHQYVGDEVVITWPVMAGLQSNNCIDCFFRIESRLEQLRSKYERKFQAIPSFKAGLHLGEATVGEIGVIKKDIVYSGDVLNTTSRIQRECNKYGAELLISGHLLKRLPRNDQYQMESIGNIDLRGKMEKLSLYAVRLADKSK
jgi:adenylate cyclase